MPEQGLGRDLVIRSIETADGLHCVDIVRRPDGGFGFAEYRRDPEDPSGWHPTGRQAPAPPGSAPPGSAPLGSAPLGSAESALAEARRQLPWLTEVLEP